MARVRVDPKSAAHQAVAAPLGRRLADFLTEQGKAIAHAVSRRYRFAKESAVVTLSKGERAHRIVGSLDPAPWQRFGTDSIAGPLSGIYQTGSDLGGSTDGAQQDASDYVRDRLTSLMGDDGLVGTTADDVGDLVDEALANDWSPYALARAIENSGAFSFDRAQLIAETELSAAQYAGAMSGARSAGATSKSWEIDDSVHGSDDDCDDNADDDEVGIDEAFSSGDLVPPAHPNCACWVSFYGADEDEADEDDDEEEQAA